MANGFVRRKGFTLIELMVVIAILGILAAVAVPTFIGYMRRAHTAEVPTNLGNLFKLSAALFNSEYTGRGVATSSVRSCVASPTSLIPATPNSEKQRFLAEGGFKQLGFDIPDLVHFGYAIQSVGLPDEIYCSSSHIDRSPIYTFAAYGDLDSDTQLSTFEMAVSTDSHSQLYHSPALFVVDEGE